MDPRTKRIEYLAQQIKKQRMITRRQLYPMVPPSQKVDIRTDQQMLEGYEARRVALREKLRTITSDVIASQLSRDLTDDQVYFSLNSWPRISKYLKERYALGVPANVYFYHLRDLAKEMKV
jgi:hypothetical protein